MKTKVEIPDLTIQDGNGSKTASVKKEKANEFSKYFASFLVNEPTSIISELTRPTNQPEPPNIYNIKITTETVKQKIDKLKPSKSPGPDQIHARILKECANQIALPLKKIFQSSINSGKLADIWKVSHITAIHNYETIKEKKIFVKTIAPSHSLVLS